MLQVQHFCIAAGIQLYPEELYEHGLETVTVATAGICRSPQSASEVLNYLNNIFAKLEANLAGVPEAIMLNNEGYVAEATGDNIFLVKTGAITPPPHVGILVGITQYYHGDRSRAGTESDGKTLYQT